ncbi:MAG: glycosyltransferase family 4 protein [Bacteroidales bacterium]|nr:glycosyltransferase family 4 protein [Bacteroidales bacterium]MCF8343874.1 glycosyltransferase family 4 protein [Bacteroidales bacterium]MCF8351880.1 glycosyltransferase family 4 protein [Bacteroidales bacterium]MCF8375253.1 glycosyltransferase family 4 protein [Bacteroidales bacterium]MCF8400277.1 glycosyltransferase family 4 protein [Bacteroidales bacterium]
MKIAIEGQRLFREKKHGMDMVALELIKQLQQIDKKNEYVVYVKPDSDKCLDDTDNFRIVELGGGPYPTWEQNALPKAARKDRCDILHCTSNTAPVNSKVPLIVTLHDIIYLESIAIFKKGGTWYQKLGNMYRRLVVPRVISRSKKIITVSHFEKNRIREFFGWPKNDPRLVAIYNGVSEHFKVIEDEIELKRVKDKYKLPDKFFFHLGNTDPKKNTIGVLEAYSNYIKESEDKIPLLMLDFDRQELNKMLASIGDKKLMEHIQLTGYIVNTDLPAIYNLCEIFLYPSLRESFGIPMLEAMRCGTPVITSNTSSMPEVSGGAAMIVDPFQHIQITEAIFTLLNDEKTKDRIIKEGFEQAAKFSWKAMAENVLDLYEEVYALTKNQ